MISIAKIVSTLNNWGCVKTAKYVKAIEEEGLQSRTGREFKYGNFMRGASLCVLDPVTASEIRRSVNHSYLYVRADQVKLYSRNGGTQHMTYVKNLVDRSLLNGKDLKVFDAACNHGYLATALEQKITRYIGMDLISEVIKTVNSEAVERFGKIGCSDYHFVQSNILLKSSYRDVSKDNNLIVCTGVLGHFRPFQIKILLNNFNSILSPEDKSRIIIGCPVIPENYDQNSLIVSYDKFGNIIPRPRDIEDGVKFIFERYSSGFEFRRYEKDSFLNMIQGNKQFVIDDIYEAKNGNGISSVYLSLKRK